jgi:hypothetical protein
MVRNKQTYLFLIELCGVETVGGGVQAYKVAAFVQVSLKCVLSRLIEHFFGEE